MDELAENLQSDKKDLDSSSFKDTESENGEHNAVKDDSCDDNDHVKNSEHGESVSHGTDPVSVDTNKHMEDTTDDIRSFTESEENHKVLGTETNQNVATENLDERVVGTNTTNQNVSEDKTDDEKINKDIDDNVANVTTNNDVKLDSQPDNAIEKSISQTEGQRENQPINENGEVDQNIPHKKSKRKKSKRTSKVSPGIMQSEVDVISHDAEEPEVKDDRGSELLFALKNTKKAVALKLIEDGADIHFVDQTKFNVLHYAAVAGYDDLIIKLIDLGADVKLWDCNGETPLHKASRAGHDMVVVVLVANGADVHSLNWEGKNALELAVHRKHVKVIETLCIFGADLLMQEWTWLEDAMNSNDKKDKAIVDILKRQYDRLPGFKHGGIAHVVRYVKGEKACKMKGLGLSLQPNDIQLQSPFFCHCSKLQAEFTDFKHLLSEDQDFFSDVYECRTWGSANKVHTFDVKIKGIPKCNETIDIISPDGKIGRVDSIERDEEENTTDITATVTIKPNMSTTFMFVTVEKPEVFAVTKDAVHIQPQMEPDAEIDIPEDTFDTPGDLLFNVVETKDVGEEDANLQEDPVLVTNVLDLSVSNKQQPKKPIDMKLPMHSELEEDAEVVILSSSKEYPEGLEDWEIVTAKKDPRRKCAAFKIRHFSIFTGVSKSKVDKDMEAVTKLIQKALNHERLVEFFVSVQTLPGNEFAAVVECCLQRKAKKRKRFWEKKGYELQDETISHTIQINQWFQVKFGGNIKRVGVDQTDTDKMMFQPNRDNYKIFNLQGVNPKESPAIGRLYISIINEIPQEPIRIVENINCMKSKETFIPREPKLDLFDLTALPVELNILREDDYDEMKTSKATDEDPECTILTLKFPFLWQRLSNRLTMDEAHHLSIQLKVSKIEELIEEHPQLNDFMEAMMWKWRGRRPYASQVDFLVRSLEGMGKEYEADEIKLANLEKRMIEMI